MNLRSTLKLAHYLFEQNNIPHALIGGLALACYGSTRATIDLDLLIPEEHKQKSRELLLANGFNLTNESSEVMQFSGIGYIDILIARRPISQKMLEEANLNGPEGIRFVKTEDLIGLKIQAYVNDRTREFQDKADIQFLIENVDIIDWQRVKTYAELFNEWDTINEIKNKIKS